MINPVSALAVLALHSQLLDPSLLEAKADKIRMRTYRSEGAFKAIESRCESLGANLGHEDRLHNVG